MSVLEEKIKELELELECERSTTKELSKRILKAIEYIKATGVIPKQIDIFVLLEILEGKDKE